MEKPGAMYEIVGVYGDNTKSQDWLVIEVISPARRSLMGTADYRYVVESAWKEIGQAKDHVDYLTDEKA